MVKQTTLDKVDILLFWGLLSRYVPFSRPSSLIKSFAWTELETVVLLIWMTIIFMWFAFVKLFDFYVVGKVYWKTHDYRFILSFFQAEEKASSVHQGD